MSLVALRTLTPESLIQVCVRAVRLPQVSGITHSPISGMIGGKSKGVGQLAVKPSPLVPSDPSAPAAAAAAASPSSSLANAPTLGALPALGGGGLPAMGAKKKSAGMDLPMCEQFL